MIWHITRHNKTINDDEINGNCQTQPDVISLLNKLHTTYYDSNTIKEFSHECFDEE